MRTLHFLAKTETDNEKLRTFLHNGTVILIVLKRAVKLKNATFLIAAFTLIGTVFNKG